MGEDICSYNVITKTDDKTLTIDCRRCNIGNSTIFDKNCRSNILRILQTEHGIDAIILNHALVQVFRGEELDTIKELAHFIDGISVYGDLKLPSEKFDICEKCSRNRHEEIRKIIELSKTDPIKALLNLEEIVKRKGYTDKRCVNCHRKYKDIISEMISKAEFRRRATEKTIDSEFFYAKYIRPYVRPGFIDS